MLCVRTTEGGREEEMREWRKKESNNVVYTTNYMDGVYLLVQQTYIRIRLELWSGALIWCCVLSRVAQS